MPTELQIAWGRRLREVRTERDMSGSELARKAGVTRQHIQRIETGRSAASDTVWVRIAAALEVKVDDIFSHQQQRQAS
jgi:DNA-binding XRE family transcriptional regulator